MSLNPGSDVDTVDLLNQHNPDGTHKGVSNLKKGLESALPSSPLQGDVYIATDTKKQYNCYTNGVWEASAVDTKTSVSLNDTTPGYLNGKLVEGKGIDTVELGDGANETLEVNIHSDYVLPLAHGRLTLTSGNPVTISDVTAAATLYYTPHNGNRLALYDGTRWNLHVFTERSLSLSGLIKGVTYDIFIYNNAGTLTLEAVAWNKVTASNSPTAGSNKVINLSSTTGLAIGMNVTVRDGSNSEIAVITAVSAGVSITVATLVSSYTLPDVYGYLARATSLAFQDGVYVKSGAATRRYLGSIGITSTTGQTEDSAARRLVWNMYNQVSRKLLKQFTTASWTSNGLQMVDNSAANRVEVVTGLDTSLCDLHATLNAYRSSGGSRRASVHIGINSMVTKSEDIRGGTQEVIPNGVDWTPCYALLKDYRMGRVYYQGIEDAGGVTTTFYGTQTAYQSGLYGTIQG